MTLRQVIISVGAFVAGALVVYALTMVLAVTVVSWLKDVPYERVLLWMCVGGLLAAAASARLGGRAR